MIGFLDTSALVPLVLDEPGSDACRRFWVSADDVVGSRLAFVEAAAALARAQRLGRLTDAFHRVCLANLEEIWLEVLPLEVDDRLVRRAAELAHQFGLRGYDAVQCASAEKVAAADLVAASGDAKLLAAWVDLGIATFNPNSTDD